MAIRKDIKEIMSKVITSTNTTLFRAYLMEPNSEMDINTSNSVYGFSIEEAVKIMLEDTGIKDPNNLVGTQISILEIVVKSKNLKNLIKLEYDDSEERQGSNQIVPIQEEIKIPNHNPVLLTPNRIKFGLIDIVRGNEEAKDFEINVFDIIPTEIRFDVDYNTQEITIREIIYDKL